MAGEKFYRIVGGQPVEIPERDPARRYWYRRILGENAYLEMTAAEESARTAEESTPRAYAGIGRCRASRTGQSVPTATATAIQFDTEQLDNANYHSTSVNPDRFTISPKQAGVYDVRVVVRFDEGSAGANANTGDRVVQIRVGAQPAVTDRRRAAAGGDTEVALVADVELAAGDVVRAGVLQTSGAAMTVDARISLLRRVEGA